MLQVQKLAANKTLRMLATLAFMFTIFLVSGADFVGAESNRDAAALVGVSQSGDDGAAIIEEGKGLVYLMMAVGILIIVGCLIAAGVKLAAASQGQKRTEAIWWIVGAFAGAFVVYKAFDLLGHAISFGAS